MKTKMIKQGMLVWSLIAMMVFSFGLSNVASAGPKQGEIKFKIDEIEFMDARTLAVKGYWYSVAREDYVVCRFSYLLNVYDEDGELLFQLPLRHFQPCKRVLVPAGAQSEPCTLYINDPEIRPYNGAITWEGGIMLSTWESPKKR